MQNEKPESGPDEDVRSATARTPRRRLFTTRPEIVGQFGAIATSHWLGTSVGMSILEKGGNAIDAATAAAFVLQVALPEFNGIGGEVVMLLKVARETHVRTVCGQGVAPRSASLAHFDKLSLSAVPERGGLAATTPGAFDAWMLVFRDFGSLKLREVLWPTIEYARRGTPSSAYLVRQLAAQNSFFSAEWATNAALIPDLLPGDNGIGNINHALAATLQRLLCLAEAAGPDRAEQIEAARQAFSSGFIADAIDRASQLSHAFEKGGERYSGLLTGSDLENWVATYEQPVSLAYGKYEVLKPGPWTQGPTILQCLALAQESKFDFSCGDNADFYHRTIEIIKLSFADRNRFYGDPLFVDVPLDTLLGPSYIRTRHLLIDNAYAAAVVRPGSLPGSPKAFSASEPLIESDPERTEARMRGNQLGGTVSIAVADSEGTMISAVPSGGTIFESPIIANLGFGLGARGAFFRLSENHPNTLMPGKRPRTTLSPTMVLQDGEPILACGTPGGDQQDQWQLSFLLRYLGGRSSLQQAIEAPNFQSENFESSFPPFKARPNRVTVESRVPNEVVESLQQRNHDVVRADDWILGSITAVARDGPLLKVAACPRNRMCYAIGR
ncbi:gamma-glutamyltransferase family protein [Rhizobium rhizogenes]|uniref:gamma-glutamyltransferase family protein n=1 Tax=Rhizobium rhizogenes TaxID=359 RepID=UPI0012971C83|nr:gamma-glutamyltransferase [Rhizobium rhizogenes]MQB34206.1 gamma-glutamyltransferase family protein [Rhizobium rhizogenes]